MKKEESSDNSFGVVGVIFGILSIIFSSAVGIALGIIGLIFSLQQKKRMKNKWSKAGVILSIIGIIIGILVFLFVLKNILSNSELLGQIQQVGNAP